MPKNNSESGPLTKDFFRDYLSKHFKKELRNDFVSKTYFRSHLRLELNKLLEGLETLIKIEVGGLRKEISQWREEDKLRLNSIENQVDDHETRITKLETSVS